jgi:hypothetical protein
VWNTDTPLSVSKTREYLLGQVAALARILELELPHEVRDWFRNSMANACHANAERNLQERSLREAWRWHLRSLRQPRGLRHLLFTRQLVRALWTTRAGQ